MLAINYLSKTEDPDVEFTHRRLIPMQASDEHRVVNVLLDHVAASRLLLLKIIFDCVQIGHDFDAISPVGVLSRFNDPHP